MSISSGDIKTYGSTYMQETDIGTQGGNIDITTSVIFDNPNLTNTPSGIVSACSNLITDTGININIVGRNIGGSIVSGSIILNGLTTVSGTTSFERLLKILVGNHSGQISIKDSLDNLITTIDSGILCVRRPFYNVSADSSTGSEKKYYEKIFIKNTNTTYNLLEPTISEIATGIYSSVAFDLEKYSTLNVSYGANTSINRRTAPNITGMQSGSFDSVVKNLNQDIDLITSGAIGVWLELTLLPGTIASKNIYTLSISGSTI